MAIPHLQRRTCGLATSSFQSPSAACGKYIYRYISRDSDNRYLRSSVIV